MLAIIHDCDPGADDVLALLLALGSPRDCRVIAVTSVRGNVSATQGATNALRVLALAGRDDVDVYVGSDAPLFGDAREGDAAFGVTGMGGLELPMTDRLPRPGSAVECIIERTLSLGPGELTLCATGPLTNVAAAFSREPRVPERLREVVVMGGAFAVPAVGRRRRGNITEYSEFNFYMDPHAAQRVFSSTARMTLIPLQGS